jgi:hypothetical protein
VHKHLNRFILKTLKRFRKLGGLPGLVQNKEFK